MERYYKKILIVGKKPSSRVEGVDHVADDLVSLAKMNKRHHYDLIVIIPSKAFFQKTPGVRLTPVELARPGVSDIDSDSPEDLIAKLAIRAFHSLIMASLSNTDVVVFYSKEGQQFPWKLSMAQSAHCGICSLAPNDYDHPLLSLPWSELVPQGEYIFRTNKIHRLKDLLGITDFRLPDKTTVSCRKMLFNMSGLLSQEITISCPFQNNLEQLVGVFGPSAHSEGCFLILPEPHDTDEAMGAILNFSESVGSESNALPNQEPESCDDSAPRDEREDAGTRELIDLEMSKLPKYKRPEVEAVLVEFYKKYDECKANDSAKNARAIIREITDDKISEGERRTLMGYLYEREVRGILYTEYEDLRAESPLLHPKQTLDRLRKRHSGKYKPAFKKSVYLLCLRRHYVDFFQEADELLKRKKLNYHLAARAVKDSSPEKYLFTVEVYAYHLRERAKNPSSWQAIL